MVSHPVPKGDIVADPFPVYNIIMDFVFASFPWLITRSLEMRRAEKVGLCLTMSLGMM